MEELYHWGIRGMRWGVRRYQNPDGTLTEAGKARYGASYKTYDEALEARKSEERMNKALKSGDVRKLSNDELSKVNQRLNMELTYKRAMEQVRPAKQHRARRVLADIAETAAKDLARKAFTKLGEKIFEQKDSYNEYSLMELDRLTDKQLKAYSDRMKLKGDILNVQYGKGTSIIGVKKKAQDEARKQADEVKRDEEARAAEKSARQAIKEANQKLERYQKEEQKARRNAEKQETRDLISRMSSKQSSSFERSWDRAAEKEARYQKSKDVEVMRNFISSWASTPSSSASSNSSVAKSVISKHDVDKYSEAEDFLAFFYGGLDIRHSDLSELFLAHHGIKGQKWGVRRYQNADGTLTEEGLKRYRKDMGLDGRKPIDSGVARMRSDKISLYKDLPDSLKKEIKSVVEKQMDAEDDLERDSELEELYLDTYVYLTNIAEKLLGSHAKDTYQTVYWWARKDGPQETAITDLIYNDFQYNAAKDIVDERRRAKRTNIG